METHKKVAAFGHTAFGHTAFGHTAFGHTAFLTNTCFKLCSFEPTRTYKPLDFYCKCCSIWEKWKSCNFCIFSSLHKQLFFCEHTYCICTKKMYNNRKQNKEKCIKNVVLYRKITPFPPWGFSNEWLTLAELDR